MSRSAVRLFSLGDAGDVAIACSADGVRIEAITLADGWQVGSRFPDGLLARRRPADSVGVTLRNGDTRDATAEAELEIGRCDDGRWENEEVTVSVNTTVDEPTKYYLVEVVYFTSANAGYTGTVAF